MHTVDTKSSLKYFRDFWCSPATCETLTVFTLPNVKMVSLQWLWKTFVLSHLPLFSFQDAYTKIRIHGSRRKGVIIQSNVVASNGIIHIINKLMERVPPTVESNTEVARLKDFSLDVNVLSKDKPVHYVSIHLITWTLCCSTGEPDEDRFWLWQVSDFHQFITGIDYFSSIRGTSGHECMQTKMPTFLLSV